MKRLLCAETPAAAVAVAALLAVAAGLTVMARANDPVNRQVGDAKPETRGENIERGRYLVHHVAHCVDCHTPRDERGRMIRSRLLTGAPIPVAGPDFGRPWAAASVALAGLGNYDEPFVRHLLTRGFRRDGTSPKSPMPSFKLSEQDAKDVIAYLKSVKSRF